MANTTLTQGVSEPLLFLVDNADEGESWELVSITSLAGDDVGLSRIGEPLVYPLVLSPYPGVLGAYYSAPIRIDVAGKFVALFRRTGTVDTTIVGIDVNEVVVPGDEVVLPSVPVLSDENLATARIVLINIDGTAIKDFGVYFYPVGSPYRVSDGVILGGEATVGLIGKPIKVSTNSFGVAQLKLVKGARVRVAFEGSNFIREITVPDEDFSLLGPVSEAPDMLQIVIPEYTMAIRVS